MANCKVCGEKIEENEAITFDSNCKDCLIDKWIDTVGECHWIGYKPNPNK